MTMNDDGPLAPGRLLLIRHAETDDNVQRLMCGWTDSCLSQRGLEQAARLGAYVAATYPIDRLYSSPLQRAWLTADAIARLMALIPQPVDDLREINFGQLEGVTWDHFEANFPDLVQTWRDSANLSHGWPGGESRQAFQARVTRALGFLEVESQTRHVAVVSHGGVIANYLASRLAGDGT